MQFGRRFRRDVKIVRLDIGPGEPSRNRGIGMGIDGSAKAVMALMVGEAQAREDELADRLKSKWAVHLREDDDRRGAQLPPPLSYDQRTIHPPEAARGGLRADRPRRWRLGRRAGLVLHPHPGVST